jgi:hypothetical protein
MKDQNAAIGFKIENAPSEMALVVSMDPPFPGGGQG